MADHVKIKRMFVFSYITVSTTGKIHARRHQWISWWVCFPPWLRSGAPSRAWPAAVWCCSAEEKQWKTLSSGRIGANPVRTKSPLMGFLQWTLVTRVTMIQQEWLHADARSASSLYCRAAWGRHFYHRKPNEATWAVWGNVSCAKAARETWHSKRLDTFSFV